MWRFEIDGEEYGDDVLDEVFEREFISARTSKLSRFVEAGIKRFHYTYDFEDNWVHTIDIERTLEAHPKVKYPRCIDGKRACPPESCGGPWGYENVLESLADLDLEEHEQRLEWLDDEFDAEAFDLDGINRKLAKTR